MSGFDLRVIDAILALIAIEGVGLTAWRALGRPGPRFAPLVASLIAGAALLVAFRAAASGAPPLLVGAALAVAGVAHLADLASRWPASGEASRPPRRIISHATISLRADKRQRPRGGGAEA